MSEDWQTVGAAGARALAEGKPDEAAERFARVVELRPDHADSWFNLAYALRHGRRYEEALDAYARAIEQGVAGPAEAHVNRAIILSEHLDRSDDARAELRRAIALAPGFALAWFNLGMLEEDWGDAAAAADAYRSALAADPAMGRAQARLAAIATHRCEPAAAIAMLERSLAASAATGEDRAEMEFALGNALDAAGLYPEAFESVQRANARMAALRPAHARYDPAAQERLVDSLIAAFPEPPGLEAAPQDRRPIFVCGMFRSGSTVVEQLLARHPAIAAGGELETLPALVRERLQPYPESLARLKKAHIAALRDQYLAETDRLAADGAAHVTDKRPDNFLHIGLIKTLFPGARIVHTVRDPRDIALSTWFLNFAEAVSYSERLEHIGHYIGQYRRLMGHWSSLFDGDVVDVDYDRLVRDPAGTLADTFRALGLDPAAASGQASGGAVIRTPSNWQARAPLHARSSGRWRNYELQLAPLLRGLL